MDIGVRVLSGVPVVGVRVLSGVLVGGMAIYVAADNGVGMSAVSLSPPQAASIIANSINPSASSTVCLIPASMGVPLSAV